MILDMRHVDYEMQKAKEATVIVNAHLSGIINDNIEGCNAKIISFDTFRHNRTCNRHEMNEFMKNYKYIFPQLELIDLSRALSPDVDLASEEARRFHQFVKALKENTDIDIVATPELEKLFPILLQKNEEEDKLLKDAAIPLQEEKYSALQAITKLQLAQAERKLTPELCHEILEHSNNNVVTQEVISAIDTQLSQGTEQLDQYIPVLSGCIAGRIITPDNFDAIVDIAEKHIQQDNITTEDINFCFGLQEESSQSEASYQRINNLIKELIPHLPEDVRQDLDEKAALKEKKQQEYLQKRQSLKAKVDEYSDYLLLSDAVFKDVSVDQIRKISDTIYEHAEEYAPLYEKILYKIDKEKDEYKIKAASHWIEPIILRMDAFGPTGSDRQLRRMLRETVTKNQDVLHEYGHIFCEQLKKNNDSEFWMAQVKALLDKNKDDHILLMNTYEDMEQAYKAHPELIAKSLAIFKETLDYPKIENGFNDHLHTLASIVGDTAHDHPEYIDTPIEILSTLTDIEKKINTSSSKSYLRSKIDEAFDKIKQSDLTPDLKRNLTIIHEQDPKIYADAVKELLSNPQTDQQCIENAITMRLNSGLDVLIDDYDSAEGLKWNLAVLQSKSLQKKGPEAIYACADHIFKNGVLEQLKDNPNYDPSEVTQAIYDSAPAWLHRLREQISDEDDLLLLQHFDRIPKEVQKLYIGEYDGKIDNLIATDNLKNFPIISAQRLKSEVCDYVSDISSNKTFKNERSLSGMEKAAEFIKEIDGYSSPEVCVIALNEAMRIRASVAVPDKTYPCARACSHFAGNNTDIRQLVKISNDIIDNVFEQIRQRKNNPVLANNPLLTNALNNAVYCGLKDKEPLQKLMGKEAAEAFLSGDENYKKLWDKKMADDGINAYLMFEKPRDILQDTSHTEKISRLDAIRKNTYYAEGNWEKEFPELLTSSELCSYVRQCPDKADKDVVNAVKTFCKARIDDTTSEYDTSLLTSLMITYDAEAKKGIEDKELFSVLYKARFSGDSKKMQDRMKKIYSNSLTSPKLKSLCKTSHLINRLILKSNTNGK